VFPVPPLAPADVGDDGDDNDDGDDDAERTKQRQVDESIHASLTYPFRSTVAKVGTDLRGVGISEGGPHLQTSSAVKTEVFAESHVQARNFHVDQFILVGCLWFWMRRWRGADSRTCFNAVR